MIGIINYGTGNIRSVTNAVTYCTDQPVMVVDRPGDLDACSKLILPGVGAFGKAMAQIREKGFDSAIQEQVKKGKYVLGICLGMQLLAGESHEFGSCAGLDLIPGEIRALDRGSKDLRIPHMGWNHIDINTLDPIFHGISNQTDFYFAHSYCFDPENTGHVLAKTGYGIEFASVIGKDNVYGVQFHPEKSQGAGLALINNFVGFKS